MENTVENVEFKTVEENKMTSSKKPKFTILVILAIIFGMSTGFVLFQRKTTESSSNKPQMIQNGNSNIVGSTASNFDKEAEGVMQKNDGKLVKEGTHILTRGDVSQTVYLTSSVIDLDQYVGAKVRIWGQTLNVKNAGWFMDVGKLEKL